MSEFGITRNTCPFCEHKGLVLFHEHYYFCPDCSAIFTFNVVQKSNCNHLADRAPTAIREPWYREKRENTLYIKENPNGEQECSKCGAECIADGW